MSAQTNETFPRHDSAHKQVAGTATYIDDMPDVAGTLHACLGLSDFAHGTIHDIDFTKVKSHPSVIGVLSGDDIPGANDISPTGKEDDPVFARDITFNGQSVFAVIAETRQAARHAAQKAIFASTNKTPNVDILNALGDGADLVTEPLTLQRGDANKALESSTQRLQGQMRIGGQDHFYLEGQIALAIPGEDDDVTIFSSTQHPSEVQHMVAHVLDVPFNAVTVKVRRMGGAFGGKESQANIFAAVAAIAAKKYNRPVKIRPDRDDDMIVTGKRHDFLVDYDVGFDDAGKIEAVKATYNARCGNSADLSGPVTDRALFHADNCYFYPNVHLQSAPLRTHTVSNTAFRGFGGPQGMLGAERIIEEIAYALQKDPLAIRKANFYGGKDRDITPYHQPVDDNIIERLVEELEDTSDYAARRKAVLDFNKSSRFIKKGIALTPVKFGISFTATWFNQAGALLLVYTDGTLQLNHGGTEMGQGLNSKVADIVAKIFGVDVEKVKITATDTSKVPNTSATAASSGSDLNGMAAANAANEIKQRLIDFAVEKYQINASEVEFAAGRVCAKDWSVSFGELVKAAYMARVQLSAAGFYKTPKIHWDRERGMGHPFYYFAYGAAVSEVSIDTLTGEYQVDRVDILHDVGRSLNPEIDRGQIEGGFIQGMGWLTTEELWWDDEGRLRTHAPSTYKIPLASDIPPVFNVALADWSENREMTIRRSKAVGEPPLMLAMSVLEALSMAVASTADYKLCPKLDTPATPECVLMAIEDLNLRKGALK